MLWRALSIFLFSSLLAPGAEWTQFRGPNGSGVSDSTGIPVEFGPNKNLVWRISLPSGHSSPVLTSDHIFLTAVEGQKLLTICLDRGSGKELWRREVPRPRQQHLHANNNPASPSPVTDGKNVYVFFTDFGLMSFTPDGQERWRHPLGPFNNPFGMAASPVLAANTLLLNCDSETGSFMIAVDKNTGARKWRVERPDATRGFSTPLVYQPPDGPLQILVTGSYRLTAYAVENGETVWWVGGLTWQLKPTPVMREDTIYVLGWAGGSDTGQQENVPPFEEVLKSWDKNHDGKLSKDEIPEPKILQDWNETDLNNDGFLDERDWRFYRSKRSAQNGMNAFRLGGHGDMTEKNTIWQYTKSLPNATSPLLYKDVLYMVKEGGILTSLDPATGRVLKQGRMSGAPGYYYSSPVAADGKLFAISEEGKVTVLKAGADWEILAVNDMEDECHATPAIVDGRIYLRTHTALWCFAQGAAPRP
jgi:outer membrane protein assembly factor BamB